jgi:hypothetical protein
MVAAMRFGKKLKLPSTAAIKHQLLLMWRADLTAIEAASAMVVSQAVPPREDKSHD